MASSSSARPAKDAKYSLEHYGGVAECPTNWTPLVKPVVMPCCDIEIEKKSLDLWKRLREKNPCCPYCFEEGVVDSCSVDSKLQMSNMIALYLNPSRLSDLDCEQRSEVLSWWRSHRSELDKIDGLYQSIHGKKPDGFGLEGGAALMANMGLPWSLFPGVGLPQLDAKWTPVQRS